VRTAHAPRARLPAHACLVMRRDLNTHNFSVSCHIRETSQMHVESRGTGVYR
jgi:hypothetical protein